MNNPIWDSTVTIYNCYEDENDEIRWFRHVVSGCFVKKNKQAFVSGDTMLTRDVHIIRIPKQPNYLPVYEWKDNPERSDYITLKPQDVIFYGSLDNDVNEYVAGQRMSDLMMKYKATGCCRISSFNDNTTLPNAHYKIEGE